MHLMSRLPHIRNLTLLASLAWVSVPQSARAQTWVGNRQGPALTEILTIDATGENNWLWGSEDVAGDGLANFSPAEQAIDARTVYVATTATQFLSRVYFSISAQEPGNVTSYVFIDADRSQLTGGTASAAGLDNGFTTDPTAGGYDYVIVVQRTGNAAVTGAVRRYNDLTQSFVNVALLANQLTAESNSFLDPLRAGQDDHGYLQSAVDLNVVGLTQACLARIYVRTTNQTQNLGRGDLDVGQVENCVPVTTTFYNVPVPIVIIPTSACTSDAQCPNGGVCVNGQCLLAQPCAVDANCGLNEICVQGRCVVQGGANCATNANCAGLVCQAGQCVACTSNAACGAGYVCGPEGRCLAPVGAICTTNTDCIGYLCQQGRCVACTNNAVCGAGYICAADGRCVAQVGAICATNTDCVGHLCLQGQCVACTNNAVCGTGYVCQADGRCVAQVGTNCTTNADCTGLLCQQGQCAACTSNAACGTGYVCQADGRCVLASGVATVANDGGLTLQAGERLQGGACACRAGNDGRTGPLTWLCLMGMSLLLGRAAKRERKQ